MNAFAEKSKVALRSLAILEPWIAEKTDGRYVLTEKGRLARFVQETMGDVFMQRRGGMFSAELKAEEKDRGDAANGQTLFFEMWSNYKPLDGYMNPGWGAKLIADLLLYHILDADKLYVIHLPKFQEWAFGTPGGPGSVFVRQPSLHGYRLYRQGVVEQKNWTCGYSIPVGHLIRDGVPVQVFRPLRDSGRGEKECASGQLALTI